MSKSRIIGALSAALFTFIAVSANATLIGRLPITPGGTDYQAAYDDVLGITWVTNAGLSAPDTWDNQKAWASGLNYLGFNDWRLASLPVGVAVEFCDSVSTVEECRDNELAYMYFKNINVKRTTDVTGTQIVDGVTLTDIQRDYWYGTVKKGFSFDDGRDCGGCKSDETSYGWAVRSGDVGAVPVPAAVWLFGSGLLGLIGIARRKKA